MEAKEWLPQLIFIVICLVYASGDSNGFSDFSLNSDQGLDLVALQLQSSSQGGAQSAQQQFSPQTGGISMPFSVGLGIKQDASGPQIALGGTQGSFSSVGAQGNAGANSYAGSIGSLKAGPKQQTTGTQQGLFGSNQVAGAWQFQPGKSSGPGRDEASFGQDTAKSQMNVKSSAQVSADQQAFMQQQSGGQIQISGASSAGSTGAGSAESVIYPSLFGDAELNSESYRSGSWQQYAPLQPGFVRIPSGTSVQQGIVYGYNRPLRGMVESEAETVVSMSLPIPGKTPDLLRQPETETDPVHGLALDHLYAQIPLTPSVDQLVGGRLQTDINPLISDIIIVIEASAEFGHTEASGKVTWNPFVLEFITRFINEVPLAPNGNRLGIVVVSTGIDDMIALSSNKKFILESFANLRPTFQGGCSGKGIGTANNLFYQYGRPITIKRVIHLTEASPFCSYSAMTERKFTRTCGIDVVKLVIGSSVPVQPNITSETAQWSMAEAVTLKIVWQSLMKRMFAAPIHGGWSMWSAWNKCSMLKSCDIGYQQRFRVCDNPKPKYGGAKCKGFYVDTRMCYPRVCIDTTIGHWTRWTQWTKCSAECGIGFQSRSRNCLTLAGKPSATCRGKYVEIKECMVNACPEHGGWSVWSTWSVCSVSCGTGSSIRTRQCDSPSPKLGGKHCSGSAFEEYICKSDIPCPIDGGFGPWSDFGRCSVWCGKGDQKRIRGCNNPVPQFGGKQCVGLFEDKRACDAGIPCPINGGWSEWVVVSACSVPCGMGVQVSQRACNSPEPKYGGAQCEGPSSRETICDMGIRCAVDGQWSNWSDWAPCKGNCGPGMTKRTRKCDNPRPMYGGKECVGDAVAKQPCDTGIKCAIDGNWGLWSEWSICRVKCGSQIVSRHRECNSPPPTYGGAKCFGNRIEERICDTKVSCPVPGQWSMWSAWSACSVTCAMGRKHRHRQCDNPAPRFGGSSCEGDPLEDVLCDTGVPCPIAGGWSAWIVVDSCNVDCGMGTGKRIRKCNNPSPRYGGADCEGESMEIFKCDTGIQCPLHGGWSAWSLWTQCSGSCGAGVVSRERTCTNPVPQFGGLPCKGPKREEKRCEHKIPCTVDGSWSAWSAWSVCKAKCGKGESFRERFCNSPAPINGGRPCVGASVDEKPCFSDTPCPIDGGWSKWSNPSACSASCGAGTMVITRLCNNPPPQFDGAPCKGLAKKILKCQTGIPCPVDGQWGQWSEFSKCSAECGFGIMKRVRVCDSPAATYGGKLCKGDAVETRPCRADKFCPVNGGWSSWSDFSTCSKQCGIGIKKRSRKCTNPVPQYGGADCVGLNKELKKCDTGFKCPIDGEWSKWSRWGKCSVVCGTGYKQRTRLCNNPPPKFGGGDCFGSPIEEKICKTKVKCPIDGLWSMWSEYSACSVNCGIGFKKRFRQCNSPPPQFGGLDCKGDSEDRISCDTKRHCPVDGKWSFWSAWKACSVECGRGITTRHRECTMPKPMYGGRQCVGDAFEKKVCDTGIYCPVNGGWGVWSKYSMCSVTCGYGVAQRHRACDNPVPMYGGEQCAGEKTETKKCDSGVPCPIDGGFSLWGQWSICSAKCGEGTRTRSRQCNNPKPRFGGADCSGDFIQTEVCFAKAHCPIHGGWSSWSGWFKCSADCGEGIQERDRLCNNPIPRYGGEQCPGDKIEVRTCKSGTPCPVDGGWTIWSLWTTCSVSCGTGTINRTRTCTNPEPKFGGFQCTGNDFQEKLCDSGTPCVVVIDGNWSGWSRWGVCEATCGAGKQIRYRTCTSPQPQNGGRVCGGESEQWQDCMSDIPCPIDGGWTFWSLWGMCEGSCGMGVQYRERSCTNSVPKYGGRKCHGPKKESQKCDTGMKCAIDGQWSMWGAWGMCKAKCGMGRQVRLRTCSNPKPQYGGRNCIGEAELWRDCDSGFSCAIDGGWSDWSKWGFCIGTCGWGVQYRSRSCTNPAPQYGGVDCQGKLEESRKCNTGLKCKIHGDWSLWGSWSICEAECGMGKQFRKRTCDNPPPQHGGSFCDGKSDEWRQCISDVPCPVDGGWSQWTLWGFCMGDCGMGFQYRERTCTAPVPMHGGKKCHGKSEESRKCDTGMKCKVHGQWSLWGEWGMCEAECGMGKQVRLRTCTNPKPQYGGNVCGGSHKDWRECNSGRPCSIDGGWSKWSVWGFCIGDCGMGLQYRTRTCTEPSPNFGGAKCQGHNEESKPCDVGVECKVVVDGQWAIWGAWGICKAECGMGKQVRSRTCSNPKPQNGGHFCAGKHEEWRVCNSGMACPINGGWSKWSIWGFCVGECGMGEQYRTRTCTEPLPQFGGAMCGGENEQSRPCNTGMKCKIHGQWSLWGAWGLCKAECGMGKQMRSRTCSNPKPQYGGNSCDGFAKEWRKCFSGTSCPVNGGWAAWGQWGFCKGKCDMGFQLRTRTCTAPAPQFGGSDCKGKAEESKACDTGKPCNPVIHGGWSVWTLWSGCSATCGKGVEGRRRQCNNPVPQNGGMFCKGKHEELRTCFADQKCMIHGGWSIWGSWSMCSVSCGGGYKARLRYCNNPAPMNGGQDCFGSPEERIPCKGSANCAVDGGWSLWTKWGACSATCGKGMLERRRFCDNPRPQYGGKPCKGPHMDQMPCFDNPPCPGQWGQWLGWQRCNCATRQQTRVRICTTRTGCIGPDTMERKCSYEDLVKDCSRGEWQKWSLWSACAGSCGSGTQERTRVCINTITGGISTDCQGPRIEVKPCKLRPCIKKEWDNWSRWSICSKTCGQGTRMRTRVCRDTATGEAVQGCKGRPQQIAPCHVLPCPTKKIDCSVECKWDNGIGYNVYPGDCSMFIQCETLNGNPLIQQCSWGLLWNLDILQCTYPHMSKCDKCSKIKPGGKRAYYKTCRSYWSCPAGVPIASCCAKGYRFDQQIDDCVPDPDGICTDACPPYEDLPTKPNKTECLFRPSKESMFFYEQNIGGFWTVMPCAGGTIYSEKECQCVTDNRVNITVPAEKCLPELHLNFKDLHSDLQRNDGIHIENVKYQGDGTAYFDGKAVANMNTFSNADWGPEVSMFVRFKPDGKGRRQGLIHNSGCGPSDIGPSVFVGFDRVGSGLQMKFSAVTAKTIEYQFINITTADNRMIDAWFTFSKGQFTAKVNGVSTTLSLPGNAIARRHGALNIGGNLCQIGTEAFEGFIGVIDEVKIYKCKPGVL